MELLTTLRNGRKVYFAPKGRAATHFADTPQLRSLVVDFLSKQTFHEPIVFIEHNTGSIVGKTDLVETTDVDDIIYTKRLNRNTYTRFAKGRVSKPTSYITIALKQEDHGGYELTSAWVGRTCPNFPDEPNATPESKPFWATHALAWGAQAVQAGTETTTCPW